MRRGGNVHITDGATACPWSAFGLFLPDATGRFGSISVVNDRQLLAVCRQRHPIGRMSSWPWFLTLPTMLLTGYHSKSSVGWQCSRAISSARSEER